MYSQSYTHFNTVFLITLLASFLTCRDCFTSVISKRQIETAVTLSPLQRAFLLLLHVVAKGSGHGADTGNNDAPENKAREQRGRPDIAAIEFHFSLH